MTYLKLSLLSLSLAALMLGCSKNDNDNDPLVPEIESIQIDGFDDNTTTIHSLSTELQLTANILYSDGTASTATSQLEWDSNDTDTSLTSSIIVHNGLCVATKNHGAELISASYREKLYTKENEQKLITIDPLSKVVITHNDQNITKLDINTTGEQPLIAKGVFESNDTIESISSYIDWNSTNTTVATVSSTGIINVLVTGAAKINVFVYNEINASIDLNVTITP